jgi:glutamyl endopeptidase
MSVGHKSRGSDERRRRRSVQESAVAIAETPTLVSELEDVPDYTKPSVAPAASPNGAPDAAVGAFGPAALPEVVLGADDRVRVPDTTLAPWRQICALRIRAADGRRFIGTGWFINSRTVITAGHCVFMHDHGGWAAEIEVIPGLDGTDRPFGEATSSRLRAVDGWIDDADPTHDYGAILLDEDLGQNTGSFAFAALSDIELTASDANISGYPGDLENGRRQFFHARTIQQVTPNRLLYDIDTFGGQSGSGIWLKTGGDRVAIGIHTTGSSSGNSGVRIIQPIVENLQRWMKESSGG